jgi:carbon starvation protein CstA
MAKWSSIGKPYVPFISTRVYAKLFRNGSKSKIAITTKSNPTIILVLIISVLAILIKLITYKTPEDLKSVAIYILVAIGILWLDRVIKNIAISSFETDMKLKRWHINNNEL